MLGPVANERYLEYAQDIEKSAGWLNDMIENLLNLSLAEFGGLASKKTRVDLRKVLDDVENIVRGLTSQRYLMVNFNIPQTSPTVFADEADVKRIIINLLSNSVKFTDDGGTVSVNCEANGAELLITVADTGIGVPADKIAAITEPFIRAESSMERYYPGTGLGLSLVKSMIKANDGTLSIASTEGVGATVSFTLPLA